MPEVRTELILLILINQDIGSGRLTLCYPYVTVDFQGDLLGTVGPLMQQQQQQHVTAHLHQRQQKTFKQPIYKHTRTWNDDGSSGAGGDQSLLAMC